MNCGVDARSSGGGEASLRKALRAALAGGVAVAALLTVGLAPALAATTDQAATQAPAAKKKPVHAKRDAKKKEPPPKPLEMPIIEVSIARQQLTLYDKGQVVAHAPVSTGMAGHRTPTGVFSVLEKEVFHRSNIYSGAPMPYMQRITWSGIALHAGVLPGYPASHGCIRMPPAFAVKLFHMTQRGARVLVMDDEVAPVPFESAHLFTKPKPVEKVTQLVVPPVAAAAKAVPAIRTAQTQTPNVMSDAPHAAAPAAASADAAVVPPAKSDTQSVTAAAAEKPASRSAAPDAAAPQPAKPQTAAAPADKNGDAATGTVLVTSVPVTPAHPVEVQKSFTPTVAPAAPAIAAPAPAPAAPTPAPMQAVAPVVPAIAAPAPVPAVAPAPAVLPAAPTIKASLQPYGPERPLRPGPIAVFISKKEGKLYVRKGFQPIFSAPISITHPEQPLGTHLFTAAEQNADGVSFRWLAVTMPNERAAKKKKTEVVHYVTIKGHKVRKVEKVDEPAPQPSATAAEALDRIEIPEATRDRISALMSPGASVIISDRGIGDETGSETDFIVVTSK
jgi:hypothetical protein